MAYNITHGLSPNFHSQVEQLISSAKYVVCLDESLIEVIQKEHMDSKVLFVSFFRSYHR